MDTGFIEGLLYKSESETLDFKRDQYFFVNSTDRDKSNLLKDLLAFANAWRTEDARILIGIDETNGNPSNVIGVTHHLKDADLQQFITSKTNLPLQFSYSAVEYKGAQLGVIRIPIQKRPVFATRRYGIVEQDLVYVRRESSNAVASPTEIAAKGAQDSKNMDMPILDVQLADIPRHRALGTAVEVESILVEHSNEVIQFLQGKRSGNHLFLTALEDPEYPGKLSRYLLLTKAVHQFGFVVKNAGSVLAKRVRNRGTERRGRQSAYLG